METNMLNKTISININNSFKTLYLDEFNLESSEIEQLGESACTTIILCLTGSLTIGSYFKSALYWYMYDHLRGIKDRPIDILLLLQAVIQHMICLLMVSTYTIGLSFDVTYSHHLGEAWCNVPWYGETYGLAYKNISGLGIAVMRLLYMFRGHWMTQEFGTKRMLCFISAASLVSSALMTVGVGIGNGPSSRKELSWNFCIGKSEKFREIWHGYSVIRGNDTPQYELMPNLVVLISIACIVSELACYLVIFGNRRLHNRAMMERTITETGILERRQQKSAITFVGQFRTFTVKCIIYLLMMYSMDKTPQFIYQLLAIVGIWVEFALTSIVEVTTSQNLRQYLPHNRLFR